MTKVVVLDGGSSDEREVSLRSGKAVMAALRVAGYDVTAIDPAERDAGFNTILRSGDVVFPVLHGTGGEDGAIQLELERLGCIYVGADSKSSAACFDKVGYKHTLQQAGFPVPRGELVTTESLRAHVLVSQPFVLKPFDGGSSVDTFIVRDISAFDFKLVEDAFTRHPQMLLEELVEGTEITIGVLVDNALPVIEIIPPADGEFDYDNKYNGRTQELCPPRSVSAGLQAQSSDMAVRIHQLMQVRDLSRTDMMISRDGKLYVLESNTMPGMTDQSLFPKSAAVAGLPMPELCKRLVEAALSRQN